MTDADGGGDVDDGYGGEQRWCWCRWRVNDDVIDPDDGERRWWTM
jgi:hypothetical protein